MGLERNLTCRWRPHDKRKGLYDTQCEACFQFQEGDVAENDFKFCPYCGGVIVEIQEEKNGK